MKQLKLALFLASILTVTFAQTANAGLGDYLEKKDIPGKIREEVADLDINFSTDLGDFDLVQGVNIAGKYRYEVEASYQLSLIHISEPTRP